MPSPFPGVDPYLEAQGYWPEFHLKFLNYLQEALSDHLPDDYEARLDERVRMVDVAAEAEELFKPDLAILRTSGPRRGTGGGGVAVFEPERFTTIVYDEDREAYLKVLHRADKQLVTVIELLSPGNKVGGGRRDYLQRRSAILRQDVHLVELDLLLGGERLPMRRPLPPAHFCASVARVEARVEGRYDCDVYSWTVRDRLPTLPVPLRAPDADVGIDLAAVYATVFERGRYARSVDYARPPVLSIDAEDQAWVVEQPAGR